MKKKFLSMALAATALVGVSFTSCSSDDDMDLSQQTAEITDPYVHFNINTKGVFGTRGTATTADNYLDQIDNFMVWGYFKEGATGTGVTDGGLYVGASNTVGTIIDGDGTGNWNYHTATDQVYWPATTAPLNFQAITPATDASFEITNTPDAASPYNAHLAAFVTVPAQADQKDIMFAKLDNQTSESNGKVVNLTFEHALSQVVFQGKLASTKIAATVSEISIVNVHETGTVGYIGTGAALSSDLGSDVADGTYSIGLVASPNVTSTSATNLTATGGALFMLPQTVTAWTTTSGSAVTTDAADAANNSYLKVKCTVTSAGVTLINDDYVYIPFPITWAQGKKYTYTIIFGAGTGGYDEDGNPLDAMLPISYTVVTANDWTDATAPTDYSGDYQF